MAAFANTTMIRCLDLNDDYFGKDGPHPSDLIGAVLAAASTAHADGARSSLPSPSPMKCFALWSMPSAYGSEDGTM